MTNTKSYLAIEGYFCSPDSNISKDKFKEQYKAILESKKNKPKYDNHNPPNNPIPNRSNPSREPTPKTKPRQTRTQVQMAILDMPIHNPHKRTLTPNKQNIIHNPMAYNITIHNIL